MLTWDEKYWYAEHRFEVRGELHAVLLARGVFVKGRAIVPMQEIMALIGAEASPPPAPETVQQWRRLLKAKKDAYAASGHERERG